jgi:hypothetical protein
LCFDSPPERSEGAKNSQRKGGDAWAPEPGFDNLLFSII